MMKHPVYLWLAAVSAAAFPLLAIAGGDEGGLISKAINDAMERGAAPIGATIPCYELPPGSPPGTPPGISSFTHCVLIPKDKLGQVVVSSAVPPPPVPAGRAIVVPGVPPGR